MTSIKGGDITINATEAVKDQGTEYKADKGGITLNANSHTFETAVDNVVQHTKETTGGADVRIYTTTGKDITVDGKGKGGSKDRLIKGDIAHTGNMNAANGSTLTSKRMPFIKAPISMQGKVKSRSMPAEIFALIRPATIPVKATIMLMPMLN